MKNIVILNGSPRKGGNTDELAKSFTRGATASGNNVETIYAAFEDIGACLGCNKCFEDGNNCVQQDAMQKIYGLLRDAEVLVVASPMYFYGVSSQLKTLIDRLHNPIRATFKIKKLVLLMVAADSRPMVFDSVKTMYKNMVAYFKLEDGGIVAVGGVKNKGDILERAELSEAYALGKRI